MSKRFGRNQKRKLLSQIAELEADKASLKADIKHLNEKTYIANEIIDMVYRLNPMFLSLKNAVEVSEGIWRMESHPYLRTSYRDFSANPTDRLLIETIDLHQLEADLLSSEDFRSSVVVRVRLKDATGATIKSVCRVSENGFKMMSIEQLSKEIARQLKK